MIIQERVDIILTSSNIKYFEELGYKIPRTKCKHDNKYRFKRGQTINVSVEHLKPNSKTKVLCLCEKCGKERLVRFDHLMLNKGSGFKKDGTTYCVDCFAPIRLGVGIDSQYRHYIITARRRNIEFSLSEADFLKLVKSECKYCGKFSNGKLLNRNGIDRVDNNYGYAIENCVPCCEQCNRMKHSYSKDDFISKVIEIYNHLALDKV